MTLFKRGSASTLTVRLWEFSGSALLSLFLLIVLTAYLSPLVYMLVTSLKEPAQLNDSKAPLYPAVNPQFKYEGIDYPVMVVPTAEGNKEWAMITRRRTYAEFIDPQNPGKGLIHWDGNWRALEKAYQYQVSLDIFPQLWKDAKILQAMIR